MNFIKLFTRNEPIAGLEISPDCLRLVMLHKVKSKNKDKSKDKAKIKIKQKKKILIENRIKFLAEVDLSPGIIVDGKVADEKSFVASFNALTKKIKKSNIRYLIVSLPPNHSYHQHYNFPQAIGEDKLKKTMELTATFQLPVKPEEYYVDWEKINKENDNAISLVAAKKEWVDQYSKIFAKLHLKIVAVETWPESIVRSFVPSLGANLFIQSSSEGYEFFIAKEKMIVFSRFVPLVRMVKTVAEEAGKVIDFYESDSQEKVEQIILSGKGVGELVGSKKEKWPVRAFIIELIPPFVDVSSIKEERHLWAVSFGASLRGIVDRSEDRQVSLLPISTHLAFQRQKMEIFVGFLSNLSIAISILIVLVFFAGWSMTSYVQSSFDSQVDIIRYQSTNLADVGLEDRAQIFNELVTKSSDIVRQTPRWGVFLEKIKAIEVDGVKISNFSWPGLEAEGVLSGVAVNRQQLNNFKKALEDSDLFAAINLPLTNVAQKNDIAFTVSLTLKDPTLYYFQ